MEKEQVTVKALDEACFNSIYSDTKLGRLKLSKRIYYKFFHIKIFFRKLFHDFNDAKKFFKYRRFFRKDWDILVGCSIENFSKPEVYIYPEMIVHLIKKYKLDPRSLDSCDGDGVGSAAIGFSPKTQKWYGWSHRAIYGFKIGDIVEVGDTVTTSGYTEEFEKMNPEEAFKHVLPVGFEAKTLCDAKRMAMAFASSVS